MSKKDFNYTQKFLSKSSIALYRTGKQNTADSTSKYKNHSQSKYVHTHTVSPGVMLNVMLNSCSGRMAGMRCATGQQYAQD